ncbi:MAG: Cas9 inhibitor AcrIIA9 family protein [Eubacteriales bacterium]|nr:Cas9 inhibitor AcrIIA9 family protein [Eubacteriales bacterium]
MLEKIIRNVSELNAVALRLRQDGNLEEIRKLAKEWVIPYPQTEDFIHGKRYRLAEDPIAEKNFRTPFEKLREEMLALDDKSFADIVGWHLFQKCREDEELSAQVLKKQKSLQRCLDFITGKAFELATEQVKQKGMERVQENTALAITEKEVFPWAEEYYRKEDEAEVEEKAAAEKKKILAAWEAAEKKGTNAGKAVKVKKAENGKAKRKTQKKADQASAPEKKKESFGQMSLFDLQQ